LRIEIAEIRQLCRDKEQKNLENEAKKKESQDFLNKSRRDSYTLSSPIFNPSELPSIPTPDNDDNYSSGKDTVVGPASLPSEVEETPINTTKETNYTELTDVEKQSVTSNSYEFFQPQIKQELKDLIDKQKSEYLRTMEELKRKFASEQQNLLARLQSNLQHYTSTPLTNNSFMANETEDENYEQFQTCLQSSGEKTIVNETDRKQRAATIITAHAKSYLVRRLMKTIYVEEIIRNIQDTLHFVLSLNEDSGRSSPMQDLLLKTKLFHQLQSDLYRFNDVFLKFSPRERIKIIAADRELRRKKLSEHNHESLDLSFQAIA
jgi:hypothetical protein